MRCGVPVRVLGSCPESEASFAPELADERMGGKHQHTELSGPGSCQSRVALCEKSTSNLP